MSKSKKVRFVMADAKAKIQELTRNRDEWVAAFEKQKEKLTTAEKKVNDANGKLAELNAMVRSYLTIWMLKTTTLSACPHCGTSNGSTVTIPDIEQPEPVKALMLVDEKVHDIGFTLEERSDTIKFNRY